MVKEIGKCSICGNEYKHYGNNTEPLDRYEHRCCDECNKKYVLPMRIKLESIKMSFGCFGN